MHYHIRAVCISYIYRYYSDFLMPFSRFAKSGINRSIECIIVVVLAIVTDFREISFVNLMTFMTHDDAGN